MKIFCSYHPTRLAHFTCHECGGSFCPDCISDRSHQKYGTTVTGYYCPKCNVPAAQLGMGNILPPFWQRIPAFFLYPFRLQPFIFMLALTLIALVFPQSMLVRFVLWVALIKYSYAVLTNTAKGNLGPPKDITGILTGDINVVFKQVGIFVVLFLAFGWVSVKLGPLFGFLFVGFAILSIPAMFMALAATDSLIHAVNPMVFVRIIYRIGWPYLLMYLFLLMMSGGPAALAPYLAAVLPAETHLFLFTLAKQYYTIMTYNLMGYVLLQYHEEIGYEVDYEAIKENPQALRKETAGGSGNRREEKLLAEVDMLIKEGRVDEAITLIGNETGGDITFPPLAQKYYNLLKLGKKTSLLLSYCKNYIDVLIRGSKYLDAFKIYQECLALSPQFVPNPDAHYKIAGWMARRGDAKGSLDTAVKFIKTNPAHQLTPEAYYLVANILHERFNNPAKAREVLGTILKKYPDHENNEKVRHYLQQLDAARA